VSTDRAPAYPRVMEELIPAACHVTEQYANNRIEADHGLLKAWLRPMRGLKRLRTAQVISAGHALVQISVVATMNSAWISTHGIASRRPSLNLPAPSDPGHQFTVKSHHPQSTQHRLDKGSVALVEDKLQAG
jgi:hypothetical protein